MPHCLTRNGTCLIGNAHPHWEYQCASPGMGLCLIPLEMGMCYAGNGMYLIRNAHPQWKWRYASLGMGCDPPIMHILIWDAHAGLYKVKNGAIFVLSMFRCHDTFHKIFAADFRPCKRIWYWNNIRPLTNQCTPSFV